MPNTVRILRSTTAAAVPSALVSGQIAINEADGKLFYRNSAGVVTAFTSSATLADGYVYDCGAYAALAPAAPTGLTVTPSAAQAVLSWTAPTNNGGAAITDYFIQFSSNAGSSYSTFSHAASTATTATITGLSAGSYLFRVSATNSVGTGSPVTSSSTSVSAAGAATLSISRSNGVSTFSGNGTLASPYARTTGLYINDADGLSRYSWTAGGAGTVYVTFNYSDDSGTSQTRSINKTRGVSTTAVSTSIDNALGVAVSVVSGDVITITASGDASQQWFGNVSVYLT